MLNLFDSCFFVFVLFKFVNFDRKLFFLINCLDFLKNLYRVWYRKMYWFWIENDCYIEYVIDIYM